MNIGAFNTPRPLPLAYFVALRGYTSYRVELFSVITFISHKQHKIQSVSSGPNGAARGSQLTPRNISHDLSFHLSVQLISSACAPPVDRCLKQSGVRWVLAGRGPVALLSIIRRAGRGVSMLGCSFAFPSAELDDDTGGGVMSSSSRPPTRSRLFSYIDLFSTISRIGSGQTGSSGAV